MTGDDSFDAALRSAFAAAEPPPDEAFLSRVEGRVRAEARLRLVVVGGAGLLGALVAAPRIGALFAGFEAPVLAAPVLGDAFAATAYSLIPTLALGAVAATAAALALLLPSRS